MISILCVQITSISVDMEVRGPKLPSEPVTQADKSEEQMKHEETKSQTFVSKYWYYIVSRDTNFMH